MRRSILGLAVVLAGCAASPPTTASAPTVTPSAPTATGDPTSAADPISLEGRILISDGGLYVANVDNTDRQLVHAEGAYCCVNRLSPDGTRILVMPGDDYTGAVRGGTLTTNGADFALLPQPDDSLNLVPSAWSPDGTRIAFEGWDNSDPARNGIYTAVAADVSDLVRVTTRPGLPHDSPLDYSPDGTQLVFYRAVRAEPDFPIDIGGWLWVATVDGSDAHPLNTGDVNPWWQARWSPDGSKILFGEERLQPTGALWTVEPDGSNLTKVFEDPNGGFANSPVWSPDGSQIMFSLHPHSDYFEHPDNSIYVINADGSGLTLVVDVPGYKYVTEWWE